MTDINDGLVNVVANLGTDRDKAALSHYVFAPMDPMSLLAAYRGSWLPRSIVDIPAQDATRKWRAWQAEATQIEKIEALEKKLRVRAKIEACKIAARLYGGAALYIGTGDKEPSKPLDPSKIKEIRSLTVLTPQELSPGEISKDIDSGFYGRPETYRLTSRGSGDQVDIHPSRLVVMEGVSIPSSQFEGVGNQGWGDSALQATIEAIRQMDSGSANVASLIFEAKVDVFKFEGFANLLKSAGGDELAIKRLTAQAVMKGINGAVVIDAQDDYEPKSASFGGLDALLDRFANLVSGAARIPVTRLFGRSAAGLSGSGDGDERVYFDRINHMQTTEIEPEMAVLDECLIHMALGGRPADIWYTWNPLRQVTEKERAEIFKTTADAARAIAGSGAGELIPVDALSDALVNELTEQGVLPGLEQKIEEYGTLAEQEPSLEEQVAALTLEQAAKGNDPDQKQVAKDAAPRTLYVRRDVLNADEITAWAKGQGLETVQEGLHVTIIHTRTPLDWIKVGQAGEWLSGDGDDGKLTISPGGPRLMERFGDAVVLQFASSRLTWRHEDIKRLGAETDFPDYQPHVTISWSADIDLTKVQPYQGKIVLGPEVFDEVNDDWKSRP